MSILGKVFQKEKKRKQPVRKIPTLPVAAAPEERVAVKSAAIPETNRLILRSHLITEKMTRIGANNQYGFIVDKSINKKTARQAIEDKYKVRVIKINIIKQKGKIKRLGRSVGRRSDFKKAIATLKEGQKINVA